MKTCIFLKFFTGLLLLLSAASAENYYLDSDDGDDGRSGTSPDQAWQTLDKITRTLLTPGDTLFFKRGCVWTGLLEMNCSGTAEAPLVYTAYGDGPRPFLNGGGAEGSVIEIDNKEYLVIRGLEITNDADSQGKRLGIGLTAAGRTIHHIHIIDCYIHDVMGNYAFNSEGKNTGGIGIFIGTGGSFDGVLIDSCEIGNIVRVGVFSTGSSGSPGNRPLKNFILRNSSIHHCAGDGLILRYADSALVEHNVAYENHNGDEGLVSYGVALWCRSTDRAIFQFNEVYNTRGGLDGQAFDADMGGTNGTLVQYNFTHDNEGGFMLVYGESQDAVVRFNISQDDGRVGGHIFDHPVWLSPRGSALIHNNTIYIGPGNNAVVSDEALDDTQFYNNIIINHGNGRLKQASNAVFHNNCLIGFSDNGGDDAAVTDGPGLAGPGTGETGASPDGYMLTEGSPCIGRGLSLAEMEGDYWPPDMGGRDYWGNTINPEVIDIGAHQYSGSRVTAHALAEAQKHNLPSKGSLILMRYADTHDRSLRFGISGRIIRTTHPVHMPGIIIK